MDYRAIITSLFVTIRLVGRRGWILQRERRADNASFSPEGRAFLFTGVEDIPRFYPDLARQPE